MRASSFLRFVDQRGVGSSRSLGRSRGSHYIGLLVDLFLSRFSAGFLLRLLFVALLGLISSFDE